MTTDAKEVNLYSITPLVKLPANVSGEFTYTSLQPLGVGDLVQIPFRNRIIQGIVAGKVTQKDSGKPAFPASLKCVDRVLEKEYLFPWQVKLAQEAATYYLTSSAVFIKSMCPKRISERNILVDRGRALGKFSIKRKEVELSRALIGKLNEDRKVLLFHADRINIYLYLLSYYLKKRKLILFLVPEQSLLNAYDILFRKVFGAEKIITLDKDASAGSYYSNWQKIKHASRAVVLGTRSAVFAPLNNIDLIVLDEAHDASHKQWDLNPRYDARHVARLIQKLVGCAVLWGTVSPNVADYYRFAKQKAIVQSNMEVDDDKPVEHVYIIDARQPGNYSQSKIFSEPVIDAIDQLTRGGKTVFLATSQKGSYGCYYCGDCGHVFKCTCCARSLYTTSGNELKCPACNQKTDLPSKCPKCQNPVIKAVGFGVGKLYEEARKLFPAVSALLVAEQTRIKRDKKHERLALFLKGGIIVGSLNFLRIARFNPHAGACFLINADKSLFFPDYTAAERRYQEIAQLKSDRLDNYVQTKFMEGLILTEALAGKYQSFYLRELSARRSDHLPPFRKVILFTVRDGNENTALTTIGELRRVIIGAIDAEHKSEFIVSDIYPGFPEKVRSKYRFHLSLAFKEREQSHIDLAVVKNAAGKSNVTIDVDPISLI